MRPTYDEVQSAIGIILRDEEKYETTLNYAVNYCKAAARMTPEGLRLQCLYILGNIAGWRHPQAKEVKAILNRYSKP